MEGVKGLRRKIIIYLVASFSLVGILFALFFIPFHNQLYNNRILEVKSKLDIIIDSRIESIGNQLFLKNYTALEVFVRDFVRYTGVARAAIYNDRGSLVGGPQEISDLQLMPAVISSADSRRYFYTDNALNEAVVVSKVTTFGETAGYILISHDLTKIEGDMLYVALFICVLVLVMFLVVNVGMQIFLRRIIVTPLDNLAGRLNIKTEDGSIDVNDIMLSIENLLYESRTKQDKQSKKDML